MHEMRRSESLFRRSGCVLCTVHGGEFRGVLAHGPEFCPEQPRYDGGIGPRSLRGAN